MVVVVGVGVRGEEIEWVVVKKKGNLPGGQVAKKTRGDTGSGAWEPFAGWDARGDRVYQFLSAFSRWLSMVAARIWRFFRCARSPLGFDGRVQSEEILPSLLVDWSGKHPRRTSQHSLWLIKWVHARATPA